MKKNILIWMLVLVCLSSFATAIDYGNGIAYYKLDANADDSGNNLNGFDLAGTSDGYYPGKVNNAINITAAGEKQEGTGFSGAKLQNIKTIQVWVNPKSTGGDSGAGYISDLYFDGDNYTQLKRANNVIWFSSKVAGVVCNAYGTEDFDIGSWQMITATRNKTGWYLYKGITEIGFCNDHNLTANATKIQLGLDYGTGIRNWDGLIDNLFMSDKFFTPQMITDSYNSGAGVEFEAPITPGDTINITGTPNPLDNESFNTQPINFNLTVNASYPFSCNLRLNSTDLVSHWSFDYNSSGLFTPDNVGVNNGTVVGATWNMSGGYDNMGAYDFDGDDDYIELTTMPTEIAHTKNYSISVWFKTNSLTTTQVIIGGDRVPQDRNYMAITSGILRFGWNNGTDSLSKSSSILTENTWYHAVGTINNEIVSLYLNNIVQTGTSVTAISGTNGFRIGATPNNIFNFNGSIDEVMIFNKSLSATEVLNLYNQTRKNFSAGTDVYVDFSQTLDEGHYSYSVECNDNTSSTSSGDSIFFIDSVDPTWTTGFKNNMVFYGGGTNTTFQFNFSDNFMLFSWNVSLDGNPIAGRFNLNTTTSQYNFSYDMRTLAGGDHNLTIRVADGHTTYSIDNYDYTNGLFNDYLKYDFDKTYVRIEAKDDSWFDSWKTIKQQDRYTFEFSPSNPSSTQTFIVESDDTINIVKKTGSYKDQWLIIGNQWMDFVNEDEPKSVVDFKRITNNVVEVTISGLIHPEKQLYSSIGDLNIVEVTYDFLITNMTVVYSDPVSELQTQTITLDINKSSPITSTDATLVWNNTRKTVTKTNYISFDRYTSSFVTPTSTLQERIINFTWNYSVISPVNNLSGNITNNQTIYIVGIDNCSTYLMRAVNITVRRDDTNALHSTDIGGYFEVWVDDENNFKAFNLTWNNVNETGICIYPNSSNYTIYSQFEYGTPPVYPLETHYLTNYTLTNTTSFLDFYLTPNSTAITFTVTDQDDNVVKDVLINILRYDFETNSHTTTEILKTDSQGEAIGNLVLTTQWYKFILVYQGAIVLTTDPVKITGTTRNFRINLQTNFFDFFETFDDTQTSLTFTNATLNYAFTFLNGDGTSVKACLKVIERGAVGDIVINESCVTSSSGTILVNIGPDVDGKKFIATGTIQVNPINLMEMLEVSFASGYKTWGKDGIFLTFFVRLTLVMIGIWSPVIAIILLMFADITMIMMGLFYMNWTTLMFYIVLGGLTMYRMKK